MCLLWLISTPSWFMPEDLSHKKAQKAQMQIKTFMPYVPSVADLDPSLVFARRLSHKKAQKAQMQTKTICALCAFCGLISTRAWFLHED